MIIERTDKKSSQADEINNKYDYCHYMHEIAKLQKKKI